MLLDLAWSADHARHLTFRSPHRFCLCSRPSSALRPSPPDEKITDPSLRVLSPDKEGYTNPNPSRNFKISRYGQSIPGERISTRVSVCRYFAPTAGSYSKLENSERDSEKYLRNRVQKTGGPQTIFQQVGKIPLHQSAQFRLSRRWDHPPAHGRVW